MVSADALPVNLVFFGLACVVLAVGLCSLLLALLKARDLLLGCLGLFSVLYGIRLLLRNDLMYAALGMPGAQFDLLAACITFVIPIPYALFAVELLGHGWKNALRIFLVAEIAFAAVAIPVAVFGHQLVLPFIINNILISLGSVVLLCHVLFLRRTEDAFARSLTGPLIVLTVAVLLENRGIRPWGLNVEPFGFVVLLAGLGYTASRRMLLSERKLAEVQQELSTARLIQSAIIPQSDPDLPILRIATRYQPMTAVAGDFFDFLQTSDTCLTILVADVSGHGVPAALVASMLKVSLSALRNHASDPAKILAGLNLMLRDSLGGQYVTVSCAAIDGPAGIITYAGAGHPPALLFQQATGNVLPLAENGLFIGPFPQATYNNMSVPFASGDKLLLYTDGIVESRVSNGEEFGQDRLAHFLQTATAAPRETVDDLFLRVRTPEQQDDLTVVLTHFV